MSNHYVVTADSLDAAGREAGDRPAKSSPGGNPPALLCVRENEPSWMALTLGLNAAGVEVPRLAWVSTAREAVVRLRDERFDCILVDAPPMATLTGGDETALGLVRGLRSAGCEDPVVLIGRLLTDNDWKEACDLDCDVFLSAKGWDSPALAFLVKRAIRHGQLLREHHRLMTADHRRLIRERDESEKLLAQQRQIINEIESLADPLKEPATSQTRGDKSARFNPNPIDRKQVATERFSTAYRDLLRSYVLMGSGSLASEIAEIADQLVEVGVAPPEALQLHVRSVEDLVKGLGNRSSRHIVARGDLLAVELMMHLASRSQRVAGALASPAPRREPTPIRNVTGAAGIDLSNGMHHT